MNTSTSLRRVIRPAETYRALRIRVEDSFLRRAMGAQHQRLETVQVELELL